MTIKYTTDHEWARESDDKSGGKLYTVGITEYAQEQLGEIVYVELPAVESVLSRGDEAAVVESVKAAGEVKSPLGGKVLAVNDQLTDSPDLVNSSPESDGWFYTLQADDDAAFGELMDADAYQKFIESLE